MCLSSNTFQRLEKNDKSEHDIFLQKLDELEAFVITMKDDQVLATDIRLYLRQKRKNIYYNYITYLEDRISDRAPRPVTYWETVWNTGKNSTTLQAL